MIFICKNDNHGIHSITSPSQALNRIISNPRHHRTLEGKKVYETKLYQTKVTIKEEEEEEEEETIGIKN